jgi:hypothetical protein
LRRKGREDKGIKGRNSKPIAEARTRDRNGEIKKQRKEG